MLAASAYFKTLSLRLRRRTNSMILSSLDRESHVHRQIVGLNIYFGTKTNCVEYFFSKGAQASKETFANLRSNCERFGQQSFSSWCPECRK